MNLELQFILSYAIGIAAIIGLVRIRRIDRVYYPFVLLLWIGLANEVLSPIMINLVKNNAINNNIYVLIESLLILLFFERLGLFRWRSQVFYTFLFLFVGGWIAENLIFFSITRFNPYFRIGYSFIIVLMSIHMINKLLVEEHKQVWKNPVFLIMVGFILFFTIKVLIEIFYLYGLVGSDAFRISLYDLITFINLFVNILFAIAVLWIPRKQEYTLL